MKKDFNFRIFMLFVFLASFSLPMKAGEVGGYRAVNAQIKPYPSGKGLVYVSDKKEDSNQWYKEKTFKGITKGGVYLYAKPKTGYSFLGFTKANSDGTISNSLKDYRTSDNPLYYTTGKYYSDSVTAAKNVPSNIEETCYAAFTKVTVKKASSFGKVDISKPVNDVGDYVTIKADRHYIYYDWEYDDWGYDEEYEYVFDKWTLNGQTVSTDTAYTFKVTQQAEYVAHYKKIEYNSSSSQSSGSTSAENPNFSNYNSSTHNNSSTSTTNYSGTTSTQSYTSSSPSSSKRSSYDYNYEWHKRFWGFSMGYVQKQWVASGDGEREKMGFWEDSKFIHGIQAGIRFEPYAKFGLGLNTGIFYEFYYSKSKTMKVDGYDVYGQLMEHALYMPLHLCYRLRLGEFQIFAFGGAGADFGIANSMKLKLEGSNEVGYESSNTYETEDSPDWKRFNASYEFGGGLRFKGLQATFTMSKGFLDMSSSGSYKMRQNKPMMVTLGYMF